MKNKHLLLGLALLGGTIALTSPLFRKNVETDLKTRVEGKLANSPNARYEDVHVAGINHLDVELSGNVATQQDRETVKPYVQREVPGVGRVTGDVTVTAAPVEPRDSTSHQESDVPPANELAQTTPDARVADKSSDVNATGLIGTEEIESATTSSVSTLVDADSSLPTNESVGALSGQDGFADDEDTAQSDELELFEDVNQDSTSDENALAQTSPQPPLTDAAAENSEDVIQEETAQTDVAQTDVAQTDVAQTDVAQTETETPDVPPSDDDPFEFRESPPRIVMEQTPEGWKLSGTVNDEETKTQIEDAIASSYPDATVANEVEVDNHVNAAGWTSELPQLVKTFKAVDATNVALTLEDGEVSLAGEVSSPQDQELVESIAGIVFGDEAVTSQVVVSELAVPPAPQQETAANDSELPVVEPPVAETPVAETPVVESPVPETPAVEIPAVETPVVETPVVETPVVETPVVETPVVETPVVETPVVELPVIETPVAETPVVPPLAQQPFEPPTEFPMLFQNEAEQPVVAEPVNNNPSPSSVQHAFPNAQQSFDQPPISLAAATRMGQIGQVVGSKTLVIGSLDHLTSYQQRGSSPTCRPCPTSTYTVPSSSPYLQPSAPQSAATSAGCYGVTVRNESLGCAEKTNSSRPKSTERKPFFEKSTRCRLRRTP